MHGLPALRQVPGDSWLDVAMIRDESQRRAHGCGDYATDGLGNVPEVVKHVQQARARGWASSA